MPGFCDFKTVGPNEHACKVCGAKVFSRHSAELIKRKCGTKPLTVKKTGKGPAKSCCGQKNGPMS